ncbi:MAG: LPS-assembly protein LptD [Treponema sp.]|nr:LPS-assembly protein LptD [Treponema sp.]MCL2272194.1 LPS-assembly protein LptD [Treponema sp.]
MKVKRDNINNRKPVPRYITLRFSFLRNLLFPALFLLVVNYLSAQEAANTVIPAEENQITQINDDRAGRTVSQERQRLEMEIRTSTLAELASWCRSLGLSEGGTREDLSRRLRQHFQLSQPETAVPGQKIITIESAQTSEYFNIEATNEEYARLSGDVRLNLKDNNFTHRISANEILFNRTRNMLTAKGSVEYIKESGDTTETFRGENITVNLNDWSSVFLDGNTEHTLDSDGTSYFFSGTVISRTGENVSILNNATITNAKNKEALWSINASKLWLLPGSDFAFFNALLKVGEIPLLYIPFFYFPVDEIIFHPVIGYRSREGGFVQTTTYIFGRPMANQTETSSITRILGNSNNMEKERHGFFLRSTGKKEANTNALSLRAFADYYTNLGAYFGAELSLPRMGILNPLDFSIGFGLTRTLSLTSTGYTPYAPNYDGTFNWDHSNMFSASVPFRYRIQLQSSLNIRNAGLSWNLPYYSDPYVNIDFMNRSESMDWFNMIQQGSTSTVTTSSDEIGSYHWNISGNYNIQVPSLSPYITGISISSISTTLGFKTMRDDEKFSNNRESPGRFFYAPDNYSIFNFSGSITGNPYSYSTGNGISAVMENTYDDPLKNIGNPVSPWIIDKEDTSPEKIVSDDLLIPPVLTQRFDLPSAGNIVFDIDYQLSPAGTSELQFLNSGWKKYDQVDWSEVQSVLSSLSGNGNLNFRMNHSRNLFTNNFTFSGRGTWRDYAYLNEDADIFHNAAGVKDETLVENWRRRQYSQTNYSASYAYSGTLRPLYQNQIFSNSNLNYGFTGTMINSKRYTAGNGPELRPVWGSWVKQDFTDGKEILGLTNHRLAANIAANAMDNIQNIVFSMDLPPLDTLINTNATFRYWLSETNINFRIKRQELLFRHGDVLLPSESAEKYEWVYEPVHFTETLVFNSQSRFSFYMVLKPEENNEITTIAASLTYKGFGFSLRVLKTNRWDFISEPENPYQGNWIETAEQTLRPNELLAFYRRRFTDIDIIKNRMNFSIDMDTSLAYNLLQYTSSNLQFQLGLNFSITNFMDIKLSATSENNVIFRYFKGFPGMNSITSMYIEGPQNNLFVDFFDSFNFFNESRRMRSGFKMKRFELKATHYLGDWRAEFGVAMYPYLNSVHVIPKYEVTADISFVVQWKPISEFKTNIEYRGETDIWIRN